MAEQWKDARARGSRKDRSLDKRDGQRVSVEGEIDSEDLTFEKSPVEACCSPADLQPTGKNLFGCGPRSESRIRLVEEKGRGNGSLEETPSRMQPSITDQICKKEN